MPPKNSSANRPQPNLALRIEDSVMTRLGSRGDEAASVGLVRTARNQILVAAVVPTATSAPFAPSAVKSIDSTRTSPQIAQVRCDAGLKRPPPHVAVANKHRYLSTLGANPGSWRARMCASKSAASAMSFASVHAPP